MGVQSVVVCLSVLLLHLAVPSESKYKDVDENCRKVLTKLDPHMNAYIGQIYDLDARHDTGDSYRYVVGVCTDVGTIEYYTDCGAMQYGVTNPNLTHCLGKVTSAQVARTSDGAWIELTYSGGGNYGSHCNKGSRTARLTFLCDPQISGRGQLEFLEENNDDSLCYYLFSVAARSVCGFPGNLTPGDIILIIFVALACLWLAAMAIGMTFKRFIVGAKGWEQIPFLDWYKSFGNLEAAVYQLSGPE